MLEDKKHALDYERREGRARFGFSAREIAMLVFLFSAVPLYLGGGRVFIAVGLVEPGTGAGLCALTFTVVVGLVLAYITWAAVRKSAKEA